MANPQRVDVQDSIELQEDGGAVKSQRREFSDAAALRKAGKNPVLRRNFNLMSMFGFSCLVLGTWQGAFITFGIGLQNGGPAGLVYSFLVVWAGTLATFVSLAELASMAPTAGGQYHWVSILAPQSCQKLFSYITGWITVAGWQSALASSVYLEGVLVQNLIELVAPAYVPQRWHGTLLTYGVILTCIFVNTVVGKALPRIESLLLVIYLLSFFGVLVPLVYLAPHGSSRDVFTTFVNGGGWSTQGLSFFVGTSGNAFAFLGADCVYHMSEEVKNAAIVVPRSIVYGLIMNGAIGLGAVIALLFCIGDPNVILKTSFTYPFIEIFKQTTKSVGGTAVMVALILLVGLSLDIGIMAAASRMLWSFARDRGVPGWRFISKVNEKNKIPVISILATTVLSVLVSLISIGSPIAFNDVVSLALVGLYGSYFVASAMLLWRRITGSIKTPDQVSSLDQLHRANSNLPGSAGNLVWGPWRVPGILGTLINAFGCIYLLIIGFFAFFPPTKQVDAATMNYSSLVMGSVAIFSAVYYVFWARKTYDGPIVETRSLS